MRWEHWLYTVPLRLRSLFRHRQVEQELDEELRLHVETLTEQHVRAGMDPTDARRAALRAMGGVDQRKEQCRDTRRVHVVEHLLQDLRYALRSFARSPGFSAVAVLTLALGIGATTAILTVVNALLLRPLPFPDAHRLVVLYATDRGRLRDVTSYPDFSDWKHQSQAFTDAAAYRRDPFNITGDGPPEPIHGLRASHELFHVLGVSPTLGRAFDAKEQQGQFPVALISHELWTRRYGNDAQILGRTILLSEVSHVVVGVMPQGFRLPPYFDTDVIVPIPEHPGRGRGYLRGVARLKPGLPASAAQQALDTIAARLAEAYPDTNRGRGVNVVALQEVAVGAVRTPLLVLLGAALFVLLIGCANVGNLVLAKGLARQRELAVRSALGAGAGRLVRQLLTESVSLALIGALLGAALAWWGSRLLVVSLAQRVPLPEVTVDWTLLAFAFGIAILSGVACGLPPALMVWRADLNDALKQGGRTQSGGVTQQRLRHLLVIAETALTVVLLVGAGLLVKSFLLLQQEDNGVDPRHVLTVDLVLSRQYADADRRAAFQRDLLESIGAVPGVQQAAVAFDPPFMEGGSREAISVDGQPDPTPKSGHGLGFNVVSAGFFRVVGIPIVRGRDFDQRDTRDGAPVAIVSESMARRFWPEGDTAGRDAVDEDAPSGDAPNRGAIGKRIRFYYNDDGPARWLTIVGVVGDVRYREGQFEPRPTFFVPYQQRGSEEPYVSLVVRTAGEPTAMAPAVRAAIWAVDKNQPIARLEAAAQTLWQSVAEPRIYMLLLGIFAAIALVMATAGIYGVSAYAVARRTQEMGIRMALGATSGQVLGLVLRHGMVLMLIGVAIGIAGSLALAKVIAGFLYGTTATDASTFVVVLLLFAVVALIATYIPARRAAAIDPTVALRFE